MIRIGPILVAATLLASGCASRRLLTLENRVLEQENAALRDELDTLRASSPPTVDYLHEPTLERISEWLDRAGYVHRYRPGDEFIQVQHVGMNTSFSIDVRRFDGDVLFLGVNDYLSLDEVHDVDTTTLLLANLAVVNYDLLLGKLQIDPGSGEILLSVELHVADGLGFGTFVRALEQLAHTADARYPELTGLLSGGGL